MPHLLARPQLSLLLDVGMTYDRVQAPRENGIVHLSQPEDEFTLCGRRIDLDSWRAKGDSEIPTCPRCVLRIPRKQEAS